MPQRLLRDGVLSLTLVIASLLPQIAPAQSREASRTAESIWSQSDAQQRAIEQIPLADRQGITTTRCQEVGVGRTGSLPRFRCTVWFLPAQAPTSPSSIPPQAPLAP